MKNRILKSGLILIALFFVFAFSSVNRGEKTIFKDKYEVMSEQIFVNTLNKNETAFDTEIKALEKKSKELDSAILFYKQKK